jgi:hypothetical protein
MTFDVSLEVVIGASLFVGGQLVTLAGVVRSNRDQGRRLGALERAEAVRTALVKDRKERRREDTRGIPIVPDEP